MLLDGTSLLVDRIAADILSCSDQRKRHGGNTQDVTARSVSLPRGTRGIIGALADVGPKCWQVGSAGAAASGARAV
ncbi:hypothetical protein [Streptomyces griseus]|uniref:hypothetical protein n=1 Tax=Streptomyces griseus TaxID=1911 RepID=UPI0036427EAE